MTDEDRTEFMTRMAVLLEIYGKESTVSLIDSYWAGLSDLSLQEFLYASGRALRESKFFPKPSELLDYAGKGEAQKKLNAALAWEIVRNAMDKYDYPQTVDFGAVTNAVIRNMGGWEWLCDRSKRDLTFDRDRFEGLYVFSTDTDIPLEKRAPLPGKYFTNVIRFNMPGEPIVVRRPALPEQESPLLKLVRDLAVKKGDKGAA